MSTDDQVDAISIARSSDDWIPANGGTETPFVSRSGARLLYCWQPSTGRHAYLNCDNDCIMSDEDAMAALGMGISWQLLTPEATGHHVG
jgi:hypothetical protein